MTSTSSGWLRTEGASSITLENNNIRTRFWELPRLSTAFLSASLLSISAVLVWVTMSALSVGLGECGWQFYLTVKGVAVHILWSFVCAIRCVVSLIYAVSNDGWLTILIVCFENKKNWQFVLHLIMSEMLCIHGCHAVSKLKPHRTTMATSRLAEYERNLNVNYDSKKSNRLNVESQRF